MEPACAQQVDVVVIGGGIAGVSAAAEVARDRSVALLEREPHPAQHASGRSASVLSETSGHPVVCALARLSRPFLASPPDGFCYHPLLSPRGVLWVGETDDAAALDALAARARAVTPTIRRLDASETSDLLGGFTPAAIAGGAVYEPDAMSIDAAAMIAAYLRALRARGGTVHTSAEAVTLHAVTGGWLVSAGGRSWRATDVVNAAGAWVDVVADRAGVRPLGCVAMRRTAAIVPAPDAVSSWPLIIDIGGRYYGEPEPGGLLVSPADETPTDPCDATPDELDVALALERFRDASGLPLRSVRRAWAGLRTFAPDRVPVLGEDPSAPGFWWLAGQGGGGIKTAPAMAELLGCALRGERFPPSAIALGISQAVLGPDRFR